ncbi:MAG: tyrosine-type recombinase/integrase [Phycisphaera sp.]|nr:tyrosine-type recombinase/integrase [Phycisphaera sp.]
MTGKPRKDRSDPNASAVFPGQAQVAAYLEGLAAGSRRTLEHSLTVIARVINEKLDIRTLPFAKKSSNESGWDWANLTAAQVRWARQELAEDYAPASVNKMLAALRGLMRTYRRLDLITEPHFQAIAQVGPVSDRKRIPSRTLSEDEIAALFRGCKADITAAGRRDAALITVLLAGGLRSEEVIELDVNDLDDPLKPRQFHVRSSIAERDRWLELDPAGRMAITEWMEVRSTQPGALLNPVDKGGTIRLRRLTGTALLGILGRRSETVGMPSVTTRDLRRTCIVRLIAAGMDLEHVRRQVGHLSWLTTGAYRELAAEHVKLLNRERSTS